MFSQIRWRIALNYAILVAVIMAGTAVYVLRPDCLGQVDCTERGFLFGGVILVAATVFLAVLVAERTAGPLRQLTGIAGRITGGDLNARMLPLRRDEVGSFILAFNDMVEALEERIEALEENQRQLSTVLAYMADGVLILDEQGRVELINPAAARLLRTTQAQALNHAYAEVVRHYKLIELWQHCRDTAQEQLEAVEIGRDLFLQVVFTPFQQQGARGYLVILQDLTQVRHLQTVRRDFISNLSHELRTPLASLRAVMETLHDGALDDPPAAQRFLNRAAAEVDTMTQMVEELLELSRIESGQVPLRLEKTAVADLILPPLDRLSPQAKRVDIELIIDLPANLPFVLADSPRMQQVITNLVHNALKFTPPNGRISLSAQSDHKKAPGQVTIAIADTGVGIASEDLPRIFERFYKSDRARTRSQGGTGLGLAIARHIVERHNGRIWVESREGKGSTFYFSLPVAE
jgi:two-component system, OmpR family, phosphate regulon sensor histidine kinase PhoR